MHEMTKTWLLAVCALAMGVAVGKRAAPLSPGRAWASGVVSPADGDARATASWSQSGPRVAVDKEEYHFGKSDVGAAGEHAFVFRNVGDQPLVLHGGKTTCGCCTCVCAVRLPQGPLAPGTSASVTLEWKSTLYVGAFRQTATILTNDPDRREVTLLVTGRFAGPVGVVPSQVSLSSVRLGQPAACEVRVYNYLKEPLEITGYALSNRETVPYFDVAWERLSAEQIQEEGEARDGYRVRIAVRPGLPAGAFQQGIALQTNSKTIPVIDIPIQGSVVSDISVAGRGWSAETGVLAMGTVKGSEGVEWPLLIVVRGPHAKDVRPKLGRVIPPLLAAELGPTRYVAETEVSLTRLTLRVPPGSKPSEHLGAGRGEPGLITIQAGHPQLSDLTIQVRFAIAE